MGVPRSDRLGGRPRTGVSWQPPPVSRPSGRWPAQRPFGRTSSSGRATRLRGRGPAVTGVVPANAAPICVKLRCAELHPVRCDVRLPRGRPGELGDHRVRERRTRSRHYACVVRLAEARVDGGNRDAALRPERVLRGERRSQAAEHGRPESAASYGCDSVVAAEVRLRIGR